MVIAPVVNVTTLLAGIEPAHLGAALVDPRAVVSALLAGVPAPGERRGAIAWPAAGARRAA